MSGSASRELIGNPASRPVIGWSVMGGVKVHTSFAKTPILILDDDEDDRLLLHYEIEQKGAQFDLFFVKDQTELSASLYPNAPDTPRREPPRLILVDGFLPHIDLQSVIRMIWESPAVQQVPVYLLITSMYEAEYLRDRYRLDCGLLQKPLKVDQLVAALNGGGDVK